MTDSIDAQLLDYYQRELTWLHRAGVDFAASHPTLAVNLKLSPGGSQDPHVERLVESFALLASRLQRRLDDGYSDFSDALLEQLYPLVLRPLPSCAIARFDPDLSKGSLSEGYVLPRGTSVFKAPEGQQTDSIYFRTCADVSLWPLTVEDVTLLDGVDAQIQTGLVGARSALCIKLSCHGEKNWAKLPIKQLRIHLAGTASNRAQLYDLLAAHCLDIVCAVPGGPKIALNAQAIPLGFAESQGLLPETDGVHPGLRLLVEYFAFPEKFAFFDIPLEVPIQANQDLELYIAFNQPPDRRMSVQREDIALGCTPLINLFPRTAEALRPDGTQSEYRLVADSHRDRSVEIHSINSLVALTDDKASQAVAPYYGCEHGQAQDGLFWHARRVSGLFPGRKGTDLMLSLVDPQFQPAKDLPRYSFIAKVLCTNRHLAQALPSNTKLKFESSGPVAKIVLLRNPSPQSLPNLSGASRWRLISQLNLNHLSLVEGPQALASLKEMLTLHNLRDEPAARVQIDQIKGLSTERVCERHGTDSWRGWRNGLEVSVQLDADDFVGSSRVLFSGVLAHFFALYANVNCFVHTVLMDADKEIMRWQPTSDPGLAL